MPDFTVDFIAKDPWQMVLVEEGPWDDVAANLRRLQDRLYSCVDAVIDGRLAERYPDSMGSIVLIRLEGYSLSRPDTREFFDRFSSAVLELPEYKAALDNSPHVSGIQFAAHFE